MENRFESLLSRKFILSVIILVAGVVFLAIGKVDYPQFLELARWVLGLYIVGNATTYGLSRIDKE